MVGEGAPRESKRTPGRWGTYALVTALGLLSIPLGTMLLYLGGLRLVPELPQAPTTVLGRSESEQQFERWDWQREIALEPLTLGGLLGVITCEGLSPWRDPRSCRSHHPGLLAAARVSQRHLQIGSHVSALEALQHASLTAWISRHWRAEEVAAYLAQSPPLDTPRP